MKKLRIDEKSRFQLLNFNENPNVGVYCRANDEVAFIQYGLSRKIKNKIISTLDVKLIELRISDATIIGSLLALNSKGVVVTDFIEDENIKKIENEGFNVYMINDRVNAVGNDVLANDNGALIHPEISDNTMKEIGKTLKVPIRKGKIASLNTVGMAAVVTNKGLLCHPKVTDEEKSVLEDLFGVSVMIGTVNHGVPFIGSGIIANSKGAIVGDLTTGIELGRIEEALNLI